jgi:nucleotide-binding universal stress UspA family protein
MFHRILVPLDGSELAERALPLAARLSRAIGGTLILARVTEAPVMPVTEMPDAQEVLALPMIEAEHTAAAEYLTRVRQMEAEAGIDVETVVLDGPVARTILAAAEQQAADLIVISSHGRTGVARWALGSVAEMIARYAPVPVLLVRGPGGPHQETREPAPLRMLVPLDGAPLAERAVAPAAQLISALSAPATSEVRLLHIITPNLVSRNAPPQSAESYAQAEVLNKASEYLAAVAARLQAEVGDAARVTITSSVRLAADVAQAIIEIADRGSAGDNGEMEARPVDCLAVATHGRSGLERWALGSVAERVLRASHLPVLIVPPEHARATDAHGKRRRVARQQPSLSHV